MGNVKIYGTEPVGDGKERIIEYGTCDEGLIAYTKNVVTGEVIFSNTVAFSSVIEIAQKENRLSKPRQEERIAALSAFLGIIPDSISPREDIAPKLFGGGCAFETTERVWFVFKATEYGGIFCSTVERLEIDTRRDDTSKCIINNGRFGWYVFPQYTEAEIDEREKRNAKFRRERNVSR